ncbi:MAG: rhamnan synthesis F family protein, partial [Roseibium sp.]
MSVSRSHSLKAGAPYALRSLTDKPQIIEVHHAPGAIDYILLPTDAFQRFQFLPLEHEVVIRAERLEARKARISLWNRNTPERIVRKSRFAAPLRYGGCIYSFDRPQKGDPKLSLADNRGMDLGSESLATLLSSQMIRDSIPKLPHGDAPAPQIDGAIAIILHLHYPHLWEEFATFFKHSKLSFQLIVTLTATNSDLEAKITSEFPGAIVRVVENLGRDVRPFIKMLQSVALENVDFICKLHGKRSILSGVSGARFGHLWRRRALLDLLGSPLQVQKILSRFQTRPQLGMIGPATLRLRNGSGSDPGFDSSLPIRRNLCAKAQMGAVNI